MAILALPFPRRLAHETFLIIHQVLAIAVVYCLWRYTQLGTLNRTFLIVSIALYGLTTLARLVRLIYRNYSLKTGWSRCGVQLRAQDMSAVEVQVTLARPMHVRSGQYVFLWIPGLCVRSIFQRHPFAIAWWNENEHGQATHLSLIVKPQSGLTCKLVTVASSLSRYLTTVEGPYGNSIRTSEYGTILLFATGMGVAGVMSLIKEVMVEKRRWQSAVRKVKLVWQVDDPSEFSHSTSHLETDSHRPLASQCATDDRSTGGVRY